ncbi:hypothetical protein ACSBR1_035726 [Camellia fascicularis]
MLLQIMRETLIYLPHLDHKDIEKQWQGLDLEQLKHIMLGNRMYIWVHDGGAGYYVIDMLWAILNNFSMENQMKFFRHMICGVLCNYGRPGLVCYKLARWQHRGHQDCREASEDEIEAVRNFLIQRYEGQKPSVDAIKSAHNDALTRRYLDKFCMV